MNTPEAQAYKLAVLWVDLAHQYFPGRANLGKIPNSGDPRNCSLFRYCWKLIRETNGILEPKDYKLYITAQLVVLKANDAQVSPNSICGDKAWKRWKFFQNQYNKKLQSQKIVIVQHENEDIDIYNAKIIGQLERTKEFLQNIEISENNFKRILDNKDLKRWVKAGKISKYYLILSTTLGNIMNMEQLEEHFGFDSKIYISNINPLIMKFFEEQFVGLA